MSDYGGDNMAKKTNLEMLEFGIEYAKKCVELEKRLEIDLWLGDSELRFKNQAITLGTLAECESAKEAEQYIYEVNVDVEGLTDNAYIDGVILCEGYVYEALYYYQGFGDTSTYGKEETAVLDSECRMVIEKHGFHLDLSNGGTIVLQCRESFKEEMKSIGWIIE